MARHSVYTTNKFSSITAILIISLLTAGIFLPMAPENTAQELAQEIKSLETAGGWSEITIGSSLEDNGKYPNIAIDTNGKIHISHINTDNNELSVSINSTETSWATNQISPSNWSVDGRSSMAFDSYGLGQLAYRTANSTVNGTYDLVYASAYNGGSGWSSNVVASGRDMGYYPSIAIDSTDDVHIIHRDNTNGKIRYATDESGTWVDSGIAVTSGSDLTGGYFNNIAIDSNDNIFVAYCNSLNNGTLVILQKTSTSWTLAYPDGQGNGCDSASMTIDDDGDVHVVYVKRSSLDFLRYCAQDGGWSCDMVDYSSSYLGESSLALDPDGDAHVAYMRANSSNQNLNDLYYTNKLGGNWSREIVTSSMAQYPSIAVDSEDTVHIAFYQPMQTNLQYTKLVTSTSSNEEIYTSLWHDGQNGKLDASLSAFNLLEFTDYSVIGNLIDENNQTLESITEINFYTGNSTNYYSTSFVQWDDTEEWWTAGEEYCLELKLVKNDEIIHTHTQCVEITEDNGEATSPEHPVFAEYVGSHWCPPCLTSSDALGELYDTNGGGSDSNDFTFISFWESSSTGWPSEGPINRRSHINNATGSQGSMPVAAFGDAEEGTYYTVGSLSSFNSYYEGGGNTVDPHNYSLEVSQTENGSNMDIEITATYTGSDSKTVYLYAAVTEEVSPESFDSSTDDHPLHVWKKWLLNSDDSGFKSISLNAGTSITESWSIPLSAVRAGGGNTAAKNFLTVAALLDGDHTNHRNLLSAADSNMFVENDDEEILADLFFAPNGTTVYPYDDIFVGEWTANGLASGSYTLKYSLADSSGNLHNGAFFEQNINTNGGNGITGSVGSWYTNSSFFNPGEQYCLTLQLFTGDDNLMDSDVDCATMPANDPVPTISNQMRYVGENDKLMPYWIASNLTAGEDYSVEHELTKSDGTSVLTEENPITPTTALYTNSPPGWSPGGGIIDWGETYCLTVTLYDSDSNFLASDGGVCKGVPEDNSSGNSGPSITGRIIQSTTAGDLDVDFTAHNLTSGTVYDVEWQITFGDESCTQSTGNQPDLAAGDNLMESDFEIPLEGLNHSIPHRLVYFANGQYDDGSCYVLSLGLYAITGETLDYYIVYVQTSAIDGGEPQSDEDGDGIADNIDQCWDGKDDWTSSSTNDHDGDGCFDGTEDWDDDNDGIEDSQDSCYLGDKNWNSWSGDENGELDHDHDGCKDTTEDLDDDNDGLMDSSDNCPLTRVGAIVDEEGCETDFPDDDNDGVANSYDNCDNTEADVEVDWYGCELWYDEDGDGVNDEEDLCPDSVEGELVDIDGCSENQRDDDGDGVPNGLDACPDTPPGFEELTDNGCAIGGADEEEIEEEVSEAADEEWWLEIPVLGEVIEQVQSKYGRYISMATVGLAILGWAYRAVTMRSEYKMERRCTKFEKRIDRAKSAKELRTIQLEVEKAQNKNLIPRGAYGDLLSRIELRAEDLGLTDFVTQDTLVEAGISQMDLQDGIEDLRAARDELNLAREDLSRAGRRGPPGQRRPETLASNEKIDSSAKSMINRPSYHPMDINQDGVVDEEDDRIWASMSEEERQQRIAQSKKRDVNLVSEIVAFSKIPNGPRAKCNCGSGKAFAKCHMRKIRCPCGSGRLFVKCCAKKRGY